MRRINVSDCPALVDELIRLKVDVFVVAAGQRSACRQERHQDNSLSFGLNLGDPVQSGLIESLAHPGANLTGITPNLAGVGRQTARAAQGDGRETCPCRRAVGPESAGV